MRTNESKKKLTRLTILGIEQTFKSKFWVIMNIVMLLGAIVAFNFSTVKQIVTEKFGNDKESKDDIVTIMSVDETGLFEEILSSKENEKIEIKEYEENAVENENVLVEINYDDECYITAKVTSKEYVDAYVYDDIKQSIDRIKCIIFARKNNISVDEVDNIIEGADIERIVTTIDITTYEKYSDILSYITLGLYVLFIFIASSLASTIGMEKVSRTTEYMLTGISENEYLWYNILQNNLVVIFQVALGVVYTFVSFIIKMILQTTFLEVEMSIATTNMTNLDIMLEPSIIFIILIALVQILLSILILSIIQAVLTSKVNNMSDVSNSTILTMFIVIFATIVFPMIIPIKENVSLVIKVVSLLPVVSTVAVPKLLLLGQVSNLYAVFSVVIAIVSMILLTIYGSKEFKKGLLSTTRGSKKEERVTKAKDTDLNDVKFKSSMSKIGVALLLYLILSNLLGMAQQMLFQTESVYINYIVKMIIWTLSIYPSYWYLRNSNYENKEEKVKEISTKEIACYTFLTFGILWLVQIICSMIVSGDYSVNDMIDLDFSSPLKVIFAFVEIALLPAIFEELLFRKAIFGSLKKYGMKIAIFVSSFAFAIMHQNFEQAILAFLIGILFCILDSKTGRIYPSMIVHFINNSIGVIQIMYGETESISLVDIIGVFCIIAMIISIISLIIMKIKKIGIFKKEEVEEYIKLSNPLRLAFSDFMTVIALVIYLLNTVYISIYVL